MTAVSSHCLFPLPSFLVYVAASVAWLQEYIVNLWTQDREASQPWSINTFQDHINNATGSSTAFDVMWAHMQKIIGKPWLASAAAVLS